jgi:7-keto-8-aminopelargonate synthetase-like enzyme
MNSFNVNSNKFFKSIQQLQQDGRYFQYFTDEYYSGRTVNVNGQELVHFANCSYLGLDNHPRLIEGAIKAITNYGVQNSMSRAILSSPLYKELETLLSRIFPAHQIVCQTVTLGHCAAIPAIIGQNDAIILDAYVHNSVRMASQLCKANGNMVLVSKHNDMEHVKYLMYRLKKDGYKNIWYFADGLYSMHGDFCDVEGIHKLLDDEESFYAYVDDAHSTGCYGKNGCGYVIGNFGLHPKMIVMHSLNKSFGVAGACLVVPDRELAEIIKMTGQTMIFSGPIQPGNLGGLIASAKLHLSSELPKYQNELKDLILYFRECNEALGLPIITKDISPIQLIRIGNLNKTLEILNNLYKSGFLVSAVMPPAVPESDTGIRISFTRHILKSDIKKLLNCISETTKSEVYLAMEE